MSTSIVSVDSSTSKFQVGGVDSFSFKPTTGIVFTQTGTGAVLSSINAKLNESISIRDFGAVGDAVTDDTTAIQNCATYCYSNNKSMYIPDGVFKITSTINWVGRPAIRGNGPASYITTSVSTIAAFTFSVNTTSINGWYLKDFNVLGPLTTDVSSTAFKFTGDSTALLQHGYCNCYVYGFGSAVKDEKVARVTGFGKEAMLNWNRWEWTLQNQGKAGFWGTQGSGTGNQWFCTAVVNGAGVPVLLFEGTGCVVGDIIAAGEWGNSTAGGVGVEVGADTVYRAQINLSMVQFDANCDVPLKLSSTGSAAYTNIIMQANNFGGNAALGSSLQPLRNSTIQDRDVSDWKAGKAYQTATTGAQTISFFDIDFATYGGMNLRVFATGPVGGVGTGVAVGEFDIRENGVGALVITSITNRLTGPASAAAITVTSSGTKATVKLTFTPTSSGTSLNATINAVGDNFKVTRL